LKTLIKNGTVVNATDSIRADVLIENGIIVAVGTGLDSQDAKIIEATGKYVFPGAIDPHTHLDMPFGAASTSDNFYSGTKAAVMGGVTTVVDFSIQSKGETLKQAIANWHKRADGKCFSDYSFHVAVTDCNDAVIAELKTLIEQTGVSTVKMFLAYKGLFQIDDGVMLKVFRAARESGVLVGLHCENGDIIDVLATEAMAAGQTAPIYHALTRPDYIEAEAITRAAAIADVVGVPLYIVHLSSAKGLAAALAARQRGQKIYIETCPQYLLLDDSRYFEPDFGGAKYVMSPPLRKIEDNGIIWQALQDDIVNVVATDHCAFNLADQKQAGRNDFRKIPNGAPGIETRFSLLYSYGVAEGKISLNQFVRLLSAEPARTMGMYPQKGTITAGSDADIVIFNPTGECVITATNLHQAVDYTPYEGFVQKGKIEHVLVGGRHVVQNCELVDDQPKGRFIFRKAVK
jgi:dihydropyrimidinase